MWFFVLSSLLSLQDDSELIRRLKRRDADAMRELYDRFGKLAFSVIVQGLTAPLALRALGVTRRKEATGRGR